MHLSDPKSMINLLLTRRSVAPSLLGEPAPTPSDLDLILQAAVRVPDHGKLAPWRIHVLHKAGQQKLGDVLAHIYAEEHPDADSKQIEIERQRPQRAALLLVVVSAPDNEQQKIPLLEQTLSAGAVCQNILLACHALGYGASWLSGWPAFHPRVHAAFGLAAHHEIAGFIYVGVPAEKPVERERVAVSDVAREWL